LGHFDAQLSTAMPDAPIKLIPAIDEAADGSD
jgi:hypothetical protein